MLDENTLRRLAKEHLPPQSAALYCLVLFGDRDRQLAPARFRNSDKLTFAECRWYGRAIGRAPVAVPALWEDADARMRIVLSAQAIGGPQMVSNPPMPHTPPCGNVVIAYGTNIIDAYDTTMGKVLGLPNRVTRRRSKTQT